MEIPSLNPLTPPPDSGPARHAGWLAAGLRPGRSLLVLLALLLAWGAVKIPWEQRIARDEQALRYQGFVLPKSLGDRIGQDAAIAFLGGMRALVANLYWLEVSSAWEDKEWFRVRERLEIVVALQPRVPVFWDLGAWHLAWNASIDLANTPAEPSAARRALDSRSWAEQGMKFLERGIAANPDDGHLWSRLAYLKEQRLQDYLGAAAAYREALRHPGSLPYMERFVGYDLEKGGDRRGAYDWWRHLWLSAAGHSDRTRLWDKVADHIRSLENELAVPPGERLFPPSPAP